MENRKTIGERMLERLKGRDRSHPTVDKKVSRFEKRFARYARIHNQSRISRFLAPEVSSHGPTFRGIGQFDESNWLCSAPYWARLQRLGNARLRRDQRLASLVSRAQERSSLTAIRRLPDVRPRGLPFMGLTGLLADQFEVLAPLPAETSADAEVSSIPRSQEQQRSWTGAGRAQSPWLSREYTPAKVSETRRRPLERIQERAPASRRTVEQARLALDQIYSRPKPVSKPARSSDDASGASTTTTRRVKRSLRGRSNPVRYVEHDFEAALPDDFLPPTRHAQGRLPEPSRPRARGLKTTMSRSPMMAAIESSRQGGSASVAAGVATRTSHNSRAASPAGRAISRRTAHRDVASSKPLLSASPVRRPAMMAPSAVAVAAHPGSHISLEREGLVEPSKAAAVAPTARVMERRSHQAEPLIEKPLASRRPVASRPVLTRQGIYAPENHVLVPGVIPVEVTEDAQPHVAERRARRATAMANASERLVDSRSQRPSSDAGDVFARPPQNIARSVRVMDAGHASRPRWARETVPTLRPNAPVRTDSGVYMPAAEVIRPDRRTVSVGVDTSIPTGIDPSIEASQSERRASVVERASARQSAEGVNRRIEQGTSVSAGERLDALSATVTATDTRRLRSPAPTTDAVVLAPLDYPLEDEALPQGQHAAQRSSRPPTVGEITSKTVRGLTARSEQALDPIIERRVAPRRFTSPLSHIRVQPSASGSRLSRGVNARDGRIVIKPEGSQSVPLAEGVSRREAQTEAYTRIDKAWQTAGRPLDWTDARVDIIQVPVMVASASGEQEAPRTVRTESGNYVPARFGTSRRSSDVMAASDSVTLTPNNGMISESSDGEILPIDPTRGDVMTRNEANRRSVGWRSGFDATVGRVESGAIHRDMPIWAQRSTGRPRIKSGDDLVQQLAQAKAPEDVVQVLMDQGNASRSATSSLPQPVIQVIQQIKTEAGRAEQEVVREQRIQSDTPSTETVRRRANRREGVRSTTRVARGMTGLNPRGNTGGQSSQAMNRVTQLAKRLQELIAMAESQNRSGARQQVRMAEDSGAAKAEGQVAPTSAESGRDSSADIDTLAREVTEQVTRELEMRRERRQEDPDGRSIWW